MKFESMGDAQIEALIAKSRQTAVKIKTGKPDTIDELILMLKWRWCQNYNLPLKHPILESYSIDELLLENYLHSDIGEIKAENTSKTIDSYKNELADSLFAEDIANEEQMQHNSQAPLTEDESAFMDSVFPKEAEEEDWKMSEKDFK